MRIFFVSHDFSGISLCRRLSAEGHEVRAWVERPDCHAYADGEIKIENSRDAGVRWAGRGGLIVCDDTGFGGWQDKLRACGFSVVGGCAEGDRIELDRAYGQRVLAANGLRTISTHKFATATAAAWFIRAHPAEWVVKLNGRADRATTYVGEMPDGSDVVDVLERSSVAAVSDRRTFQQPAVRHRRYSYVLQRRVRGVEIGVARFFNGRDWVGPIEFNVEHKRFFPGDLGPNTPEMGTLMWYDDDEGNRLFRETLAKLRSWLRRANFRGDVDLNLIVNGRGAFPLEATARFGYPALQVQMALHRSPWGEFLKAVADGRPFPLRWRRGYGVGVLVAAPPFPFKVAASRRCESCRHRPHAHAASASHGLALRFREPLGASERARLHLDGAVVHNGNDGGPVCKLHDGDGYSLHVTGTGATISAARRQAYALIAKLVLPRMYYRNDIGEAFAASERARLREWGYVR